MARNSVACSPHTWFPTSTVTPTMPGRPGLGRLGLHPRQRQLAGLVDTLGELEHLLILAHLAQRLHDALVGDVVHARGPPPVIAGDCGVAGYYSSRRTGVPGRGQRVEPGWRVPPRTASVRPGEAGRRACRVRPAPWRTPCHGLGPVWLDNGHESSARLRARPVPAGPARRPCLGRVCATCPARMTSRWPRSTRRWRTPPRSASATASRWRSRRTAWSSRPDGAARPAMRLAWWPRPPGPTSTGWCAGTWTRARRPSRRWNAVTATSGMEYGGITPVGLPADWPVLSTRRWPRPAR